MKQEVPVSQKLLLTREEAAALVNLSLPTFRKEVAPRLETKLVGAKELIVAASLKQWAEGGNA